MSSLLKNLVVVGVAVPLGVGGYHLATLLLARGGDAPGDAGAADRVTRSPYRLASLPILERDLYWLESRYVERNRLDPAAMYRAALDRVERDVPEVMVEHDLAGRRVHLAVGDHRSTLSAAPLNNLQDMAARLREAAVVLDRYLSPTVSRPEVEYSLINGALSTLDPHTILLPPVAAQDMNVDNKGEFGGLGIELIERDGQLIIKQPIADTPASRAGLKAQDHIVRIEDESTINMDLTEAVGKLRGRKGDPVNIMVMRKGMSQPRLYTIVRDTIKLNPVTGELLEGNVGYIRIKQFNNHANTDVGDLLSRLQREAGGGLRGLVLDLRNNPGGFLSEAVEVADRFLSDGVIVATVDGGTGRREEQKAKRKATLDTFPMAVLVNGNSASASEIVAGALKARDRAVIIGETSFGKGSVQNLYDHDDGSRLKLTVARYLTPGDRDIQSLGIEPDILLRPAVIRPARKQDGEKEPLASLYFREWLDREEALENVLSPDGQRDPGPAFDLRFLRNQDEDEPDGKATQDWEVLFARDLLLGGAGGRRPDVLASAGAVVEQRRNLEAERIRRAFQGIGIDWSGQGTVQPSELEVKVEAGQDGVLMAGREDTVRVLVTNHGSQPAERLSVLTRSQNPYLDHREVYFGRVEPGATVSGSFPVNLTEGYPAEWGTVKIELRTPDQEGLGVVELPVRSMSRPLPELVWSWRLLDDGQQGSQGNGDGLAQVGERLALVIDLKNRGEGSTVDAAFRLRNRSGRALDIQQGTWRIGKDGEAGPCAPPAECPVGLGPGQEATGTLLFDLREGAPEDGWSVELQLSDARAYDWLSINRQGFGDYFRQSETLHLSPDKALGSGSRAPPSIALSRLPDLRVSDDRFVLSGRVEDDTGVVDLMVFHDDDKVFYQGSRPGSTVLPFTVEGRLKPGSNALVILARDQDGLTRTRGLSVWFEAPPTQAMKPLP